MTGKIRDRGGAHLAASGQWAVYPQGRSFGACFGVEVMHAIHDNLYYGL